MKAQSWSIHPGLAVALAALLLTTLLVGAPNVAHAYILSTNLNPTNEASYSLDDLDASVGNWIASSFRTDNSAYVLNSVTLYAWQTIANTTVNLFLYSNSPSGAVSDGYLPGGGYRSSRRFTRLLIVSL